jgi:hypothetical protein
MLGGQIRVTGKELNKIVVLELMDGFERPVAPCHVEVAVDHGAVAPAWREPLNHKVQDIFLVPQFVRGPELDVVRVVAGDFEGPIAVSELAYVQHHVGAGAHVLPEIVHQHASRGPTHRVAVGQGYVKDLLFGPVSPRRVNIGMLRHSNGPFVRTRTPAAGRASWRRVPGPHV